METIVWWNRISSDGYGLGIARSRSLGIANHIQLACTAVWGNTGNSIGYFSLAYASRDARKQFVILLNEDSGTLPWNAPGALIDVANAAHCGQRDPPSSLHPASSARQQASTHFREPDTARA